MPTSITSSTHSPLPIQPSIRNEEGQPPSLIQRIKRFVVRLFSAIAKFFSSLFKTQKYTMRLQDVESKECDPSEYIHGRSSQAERRSHQPQAQRYFGHVGTASLVPSDAIEPTFRREDMPVPDLENLDDLEAEESPRPEDVHLRSSQAERRSRQHPGTARDFRDASPRVKSSSVLPVDDSESEESSESDERLHYLLFLLYQEELLLHYNGSVQEDLASNTPCASEHKENSSDESLDALEAKEPPRPEDMHCRNSQAKREPTISEYEEVTANRLREYFLHQNQNASVSNESSSTDQVESAELKESPDPMGAPGSNILVSTFSDRLNAVISSGKQQPHLT